MTEANLQSQASKAADFFSSLDSVFYFLMHYIFIPTDAIESEIHARFRGTIDNLKKKKKINPRYTVAYIRANFLNLILVNLIKGYDDVCF